MGTQLPNKDALVLLFQKDQQRFHDLVQHQGPEALQRPFTPEGWSAKDFIAHMTHWKRGTLARVVAYLHSQPLPPALPIGHEANATQRQLEVDSTLQEVIDEWNTIHVHLQHLLAQQLNESNITEEISATWDESEQIPICSLLEEMYKHDTEHLDLIEQNL